MLKEQRRMRAAVACLPLTVGLDSVEKGMTLLHFYRSGSGQFTFPMLQAVIKQLDHQGLREGAASAHEYPQDLGLAVLELQRQVSGLTSALSDEVAVLASAPGGGPVFGLGIPGSIQQVRLACTNLRGALQKFGGANRVCVIDRFWTGCWRVFKI